MPQQRAALPESWAMGMLEWECALVKRMTHSINLDLWNRFFLPFRLHFLDFFYLSGLHSRMNCSFVHKITWHARILSLFVCIILEKKKKIAKIMNPHKRDSFHHFKMRLSFDRDTMRITTKQRLIWLLLFFIKKNIVFREAHQKKSMDRQKASKSKCLSQSFSNGQFSSQSMDFHLRFVEICVVVVAVIVLLICWLKRIRIRAWCGMCVCVCACQRHTIFMNCGVIKWVIISVDRIIYQL